MADGKGVELGRRGLSCGICAVHRSASADVSAGTLATSSPFVSRSTPAAAASLARRPAILLAWARPAGTGGSGRTGRSLRGGARVAYSVPVVHFREKLSCFRKRGGFCQSMVDIGGRWVGTYHR